MALNNLKRSDLCVQYKHVAPPKSPYATNTGLSGLVNQSMPMVAMFLRNKFIGWFALIQSVHYYFNTDPEAASVAAASNKGSMDQPPLMKVLLSVVGLLVCYMNLVIPQPPMAPSRKAETA
ncbi:hypothetical protein HG537_0B02260 [Torulaspora globosa]|uniref:Uncharacterized protein n=1 Tax=Torulaspora globosa TaxID=48254 RepID=A0A7H9HM63_9SACH|nr:hypothetical protein HG537_0B02260 [Torulaspora sp. CBS 2947]